ncbi:MAG: hypothetical protein KF770_09095, partial [Anaerolineae bacterium]|nr:hypothetical protein [Anaerolineae bacterium]
VNVRSVAELLAARFHFSKCELLLWGIYTFLGKWMSRWWLIVPFASMAWSIIAIVYNFPFCCSQFPRLYFWG